MCALPASSTQISYMAVVEGRSVCSVELNAHGESEVTCCVCLLQTDVQTPCGHFLCSDCRWGLRKNTCPVCRRLLPLEGAGPHCTEQEEKGQEEDDLITDV